MSNLVDRQTNRQTNQQKWKHYLIDEGHYGIVLLSIDVDRLLVAVSVVAVTEMSWVQLWKEWNISVSPRASYRERSSAFHHPLSRILWPRVSTSPARFSATSTCWICCAASWSRYLMQKSPSFSSSTATAFTAREVDLTYRTAYVCAVVFTARYSSSVIIHAYTLTVGRSVGRRG